MSRFEYMVAVLSLLPTGPAATQTTHEAGGVPTAAELRGLIQGSWPSFALRIQQQDGLIEAPARLTSLPNALCRSEIPGTYECVSLVEYQLSSGTQRSSLLRHHVGRYDNGQLADAILIRETPAPR